MIRRENLGAIVFGGFLAECLVFAGVAAKLGFGWTILLSLAASALGVAMLRRSSLSALASLRGLAGDGFAREGALVDGMLGALGAVLLIVPGFLTDLIGLLLLAPSGRQWLLRRLRLTPGVPLPRRGADRQTIDLGHSDWTRIDNASSR